MITGPCDGKLGLFRRERNKKATDMVRRRVERKAPDPVCHTQGACSTDAHSSIMQASQGQCSLEAEGRAEATISGRGEIRWLLFFTQTRQKEEKFFGGECEKFV